MERYWDIGALNSSPTGVEVQISTAQGNCNNNAQRKYCMGACKDNSRSRYPSMNQWIGGIEGKLTNDWRKFKEDIGTGDTGFKRSKHLGGDSVTWGDLLTCVLKKIGEIASETDLARSQNTSPFWDCGHWKGVTNKNQAGVWEDNNNTQAMLMMITCIILGFKQQYLTDRAGAPKNYKELCGVANDTLAVDPEDWEKIQDGRSEELSDKIAKCGSGGNTKGCSAAALSLILTVYEAMRRCCGTCHSFTVDGWLRPGSNPNSETKSLKWNSTKRRWESDSTSNGRLMITGGSLGVYLPETKTVQTEDRLGPGHSMGRQDQQEPPPKITRAAPSTHSPITGGSNTAQSDHQPHPEDQNNLQENKGETSEASTAKPPTNHEPVTSRRGVQSDSGFPPSVSISGDNSHGQNTNDRSPHPTATQLSQHLPAGSRVEEKNNSVVQGADLTSNEPLQEDSSSPWAGMAGGIAAVAGVVASAYAYWRIFSPGSKCDQEALQSKKEKLPGFNYGRDSRKLSVGPLKLRRASVGHERGALSMKVSSTAMDAESFELREGEFRAMGD
ncbi:hypothetical protein C922_05479 [Plasmodium inui San Antonio 1]|uniref:Uncharacterized protein n=1 Tax=Plasmodium inui San Antonio 1 TaxID=1237626 RepID=W6ZT90_9APIC|nr:hypothetical protein C922_05479 [Plasmodium inui San Antonio 1]EUD64137.1 hypothetical protein C922_05479 [Plasmodium inui San Antonio 1]